MSPLKNKAKANKTDQPQPSQYSLINSYKNKSLRELITPEGVDLKIRLADQGARAGAFIIDVLIILIAIIVLSIGAAFAFKGSSFNDDGEVVAIIWILLFFFLRNFYFTAFEITPKAATPGKRLMKIRVASRKGDRLTAPAVFARNAMRELEFFLPLAFIFSGQAGVEGWITLFGLIWSCVFLFFPLFNRDRLRAGDLIAGTWVIESPRPILSRDLADTNQTEDLSGKFTEAQLGAYGVHELHVLEDVLRRNEAQTIQAVALRIRGKIDYENDPNETDRSFLQSYYRALRQKLETQLMFGKRKTDKFDKV